MNDKELSVLIDGHVRSLATASGHPLAGRLGSRANLRPGHPANVHERGQGTEFVEIGDSLFFFYRGSSILRWPKPVVGELSRFSVRVEPDPIELGGPNEVNHTVLTGFEGHFRIESDGTLVIGQQNGAPVTVVALGNPGPELGANTTC